ncbi:hypothetical protein D7B24_008484 [Verticillium nonalfalfae]|uniref:Uncharacterized protein n=1 Tax=Verticillium nonalfalfae TaxID=1051616 RepID=A0A3M9Y7Q8_9PEZI|nr:uncharacterized protein D7B24_008484 [Verticillium nonalfalfae]RNJ55528.1 hypothetical protein D7B24_008484 [Verticillium nonalfalfae]
MGADVVKCQKAASLVSALKRQKAPPETMLAENENIEKARERPSAQPVSEEVVSDLLQDYHVSLGRLCQ